MSLMVSLIFSPILDVKPFGSNLIRLRASIIGHSSLEDHYLVREVICSGYNGFSIPVTKIPLLYLQDSHSQESQ